VSDRDTINIKIKLDKAAEFAAQTRVASVEIDELGDAAERANRKSKRASGGLDELGKSAKGLGALVKPALIIGGIGLLIQLLGAATAAGVGFLGAIAPVAGLLGTLPALFLGAAQGAGVMKLAFSGVGGALGGLNSELEPKKFEALSVQGQRFVLTLNSMKAPIRDLQGKVQAGLFPGLTKGLDRAKPALEKLLGPLGKTGGVIGGIGARLGGLVGSKGFSNDLASQAEFNNRQLGRLGGAGIHVVDIFRQLTVASRPLVSWLVRLASGWAATADHTATADRASGKLTKDFQIVKHTTDDVFKVVWNLGKALFNIFDIGRKGLGESLLGSLVKGSKALDKWTESGPGIAKITGFFEKAKPVVYALAELVGAVVKDLFTFGAGQSGGLVGFSNKLRTEMLPEFLKLSEAAVHIFDFISKNVPGSSWLLTLAYAFHKIGGGGLFSGIAHGAGEQLAGSLKHAFASDAIKHEMSSAGHGLGLLMGGTLIAAVVELAKSKLGHEIEEALGLRHKQMSPLEMAFSDPATISPETLLAMGAGGRSQLQKLARADKERRYPGDVFWSESHLRSALAGERKTSSSAMQLVEGEYDHSSPRLHGAGPTLHAPTETAVKRVGRARAGEAPTHLHTHVTLKLDSTPIAEGTSEVVARRNALE
jgi:hypothetical protein